MDQENFQNASTLHFNAANSMSKAVTNLDAMAQQPKSIYEKLCLLFPDVDERYIDRICTYNPNLKSDNQPLMNKLIIHLLQEGLNHLKPRLRTGDEQNVGEPFNQNIASTSKLGNSMNVDQEKSNSSVMTTIKSNLTNRRVSTPILPIKYRAPESIYRKLRLMYPEVKKDYIQFICDNPPIPIKDKDESYILRIFVEHLVREGGNNLEKEKIVELEKKNYPVSPYPTKKRNFAQNKLKVQIHPIKQYTTNFNVESFLQLFPDPFKHFEDESRNCTYETFGLEFLKSFFCRHKVKTIVKIYSDEKCNISLAAKRLSNTEHDMKTKRGNSEMMTGNIPLLQEIAFVKNKQKIIDYLNLTKKVEEETLLNEPKDENLLITCLCCFNDECPLTELSDCNEGHLFCFDCITRGTEAALSNGETHVRCFTDCTSEFSLDALQKVLPPTVFSALLQKCQAAEVAAAKIPGLVSCPFCYFASIPPPEDKIFKCLNPECMKESCRLCRKLNHIPKKCNEDDENKALRLIEEKMTEALLRTCYECNRQFYKEDGCNKMTCPCGATMCYICDKPIRPGSNHFNGQGGLYPDRCPLYSDDQHLNAKSVSKVAKYMKHDILKKNPNLELNIEGLLPKIPEEKKGPHDNIINANRLPKHVINVVKK